MNNVQRSLIVAVLLLLGVTACGPSTVPPTEPPEPSPRPARTRTVPTPSPRLRQTRTPTASMPPLTPIRPSTRTPLPTRTAEPTCRPFDSEAPDPDVPENYIGRSYSEPPPGWVTAEGWCLDDCDYTLERVVSPDGLNVLWLEKKVLCRFPDGQPQYEIRDVLVLPPFEEGEILAISCRVGDQPDRDWEVFGYGREDCSIPGSPPGTCFVELKQAWRADRENEIFEDLPVEETRCWVETGF